ncbi:MAG: hypothetical protein IPN86_24090 [Saprospiraceae bacterium]|nr:hypothetical protein [Saprospiraceae bacterium]
MDKEINIRGNLSSMNRFDQFHEALIKMSSLPNLLHYEDRNSMAFSIESRVPFLDHRIVELAFSLPLHYKIKNGYTKWILREAMKESLPEKIFLRKDKIGFVTPGEVKWLRNELKYLVDTNFNDIPNLNSNKAKKITKSFMEGDNSNSKLIWRLANMQKWIKEQ